MTVLRINSKQTLLEVEQLFNHMFPFLKIEFFRQGSGGKIREKLDNRQVKVSDLLRGKHFSSMKFESQMTVQEIEQAFLKKCGLLIQIFRKSGPIWLETSMTSNWSLERQNQEGKMLENL